MKYLFAKIYNPLMLILIILILLLPIPALVFYVCGYIPYAFEVVVYIAYLFIAVLSLKVAIRIYISKVIRDEKREKERVGQ